MIFQLTDFGTFNLLSLYFYFCAHSPGTSVYLLYISQIFNTARKKIVLVNLYYMYLGMKTARVFAP